MGIFGGRNPSAPRITPRVVVKFAPGLRLSLSEAAEAEHAATHGDLWKVLGLKFPGVTLSLFHGSGYGHTGAPRGPRIRSRGEAEAHLLFRDRGSAPRGSR
jgi:hypothetical protein